VDRVLIIKSPVPQVAELIKAIGRFARDAKSTFRALAKEDPSIVLDNQGFPETETKTRTAISSDISKQILFRRGKELEFRLLLTQHEALIYITHLVGTLGARPIVGRVPLAEAALCGPTGSQRSRPTDRDHGSPRANPASWSGASELPLSPTLSPFLPHEPTRIQTTAGAGVVVRLGKQIDLRYSSVAEAEFADRPGRIPPSPLDSLGPGFQVTMSLGRVCGGLPGVVGPGLRGGSSGPVVLWWR